MFISTPVNIAEDNLGKIAGTFSAS